MQDGYDQTLSGLIRKRAELASETASLRAELDQRLAALDAIEAAIRVFNPDLASEYLPVNRQEVAHGNVTGDLGRFLVDVLRQYQGGPVRTTDAAEELMRARGLDARDRIVATLIRKRVTDAFRRLRKKGLVEGRQAGSGTELEWQLVR